MGPGILPETTVGKRNLPCHLQMPNKPLIMQKGSHNGKEHSPGKGSQLWNMLPNEFKVICDTKSFTLMVKPWLKINQTCTHILIIMVPY